MSKTMDGGKKMRYHWVWGTSVVEKEIWKNIYSVSGRLGEFFKDLKKI